MEHILKKNQIYLKDYKVIKAVKNTSKGVEYKINRTTYIKN